MEYRISEKNLVIRLDIGDEVKESFVKVAKAEGIAAGFIIGLGALKNFTLGYYHVDSGEYEKENFQRPHELTNLTGVISKTKENTPHVHLHATLAGPDHKAVGGHLHEGYVSAAGEFIITPVGGELLRRHIEETGLDILSFDE